MNNCIVYTRYESKVFLPISQETEVNSFKHRWTTRTLFLTFLVAISFFFGFLVQANATGKNDIAVISLDSVEASNNELLANGDFYITNVSSASSSGISGPAIIDVAPGDSLWSIANEYANGRSIRSYIRDIQRLNGLHGSVLQIGQILHLPTSD